mmetsp:Transcript_29691/g.54499  ORF Transcript_29691/g.54499 Transcript_29691/m.54499 type:complete len:153 (+) Transcript_29691:621-1079(+)
MMPGASSPNIGSSTSTSNKLERIRQEIEKCTKLEVGELKRELDSYGVSAKSCFSKKVGELRKELQPHGKSAKKYAEKKLGELKGRVESYATSMKTELKRTEADVGGAKKEVSWNGYNRAGSSTTEEPWDPSYRDVIITTFDADMLSGDVRYY